MDMKTTITIVIVLVLGILIGSLFIPNITADQSGVDSQNPPYTVVTAPGRCLSTLNEGSQHNLSQETGLHGWLLQEAHGQSRGVYYNQTIIHNISHPVNVTLQSNPSGNYNLRISTSGTYSNSIKEKPGHLRHPHCRAASPVVVSITLPLDYDSIQVTLNNRTIAEFKNNGETGLLLHDLNNTQYASKS